MLVAVAVVVVVAVVVAVVDGGAVVEAVAGKGVRQPKLAVD